MMKNLPGQRAGAKDWFDHISRFLCSKAGVTQCCLNPCLMRSANIAVLVHVDDVMLLGKRNYVENVFLPLLKSQFDLSCSLIKDVGDEFTFLKRTYRLTSHGLIISPGNYVPKMLENYGKVKISKVPIDPNMLVEDKSDELNAYDSGIYRSLVGMGLYIAQERYDIAYAIKELSSKMAKPTKSSMCGLRKLLGYLRQTSWYAVLLPTPEPGRGKIAHVDKHFILESYSDSDWSGHQAHRRSTSSAIHYVNSCPVFASARTQRVVSLSSCEAELHALVSAAADGKYIAGCLSFLAGCEVEHYGYVDNASAKSLANKRGVGKVCHLAGKLLWVQNCTADGSLKISQIRTLFNAADLATKPLSIARMRALMFLCNIVNLEHGFEMVGEDEFETLVKRDQFGKSVTKMAKMLFRIGFAMEMFTGADGLSIDDGMCTMDEAPATTSLSLWTPSGFALVFAVLAIIVVFGWMGWMIYKLQKKAELGGDQGQCGFWIQPSKDGI